MSATPDPAQSDLLARIKRLEQRLSETARNPYYPFNVINQSGNTMFRIAPSGWLDPDGNPVPFTTISDEAGDPIFQQIATGFDDNARVTRTAWAMKQNDQTVIASDGNSATGKGLAYPHLAVPLYKRWQGGTFQTNTASGDAAIVASSAVGSGILWHGFTGFVSHPALRIVGVWGNNLRAANIVYRIQFNSDTFNWTTSATASGGVVENHTFDISSWVGSDNVEVTVSITSIGASVSTDQLFCSLLGLWMVNTPGQFG